MKFKTTIVIECESIEQDQDNDIYTAEIIGETIRSGALKSVSTNRNAKALSCTCEFTREVEII